MGKAARQKRQATEKAGIAPKAVAAPYVARPFAGLPGEADLVALREIVPAATMTLPLSEGAPGVPEGAPLMVTFCTVLPMGWPALRRPDGQVLVALATVQSTGDASRDVAQALIAALEAEPGTPVATLPAATAATPRLQDLIAPAAESAVEMREDFSFWIAPDVDLDDDARASLEEANAAISPTAKMATTEAAYWCRIGGRTYLRWILPSDEDAATDALARLHAAGEDTLGEGTRLLGAFRAAGLLCPVWDLDPANEAADYEAALSAVVDRFTAALTDAPLTADERRAKSGLLSRQLTLR